MVKETFQSSEMMMRGLSVRYLCGSMKVEKLGKTAKNFGLHGLNTKTTTSPKPPLFEDSVFSTGATANAATCGSGISSKTSNDLYRPNGRCALMTQ